MMPPKKNPLELLWIGDLSVAEYRPTFDLRTKQTKPTLTNTIFHQPCRVSFQQQYIANPGMDVTSAPQRIKIFTSPDLKITPNSVLEVRQNGRYTRYKCSGQPAIYSNHQQVVVEMFDDELTVEP